MPEKTVAAPAQASSAQEATRAEERFLAPPVDIFETPDGLTVVADLPGVNHDGLSIEVKDDILTIVGRGSHKPAGQPIHREFELASFFRQFQLSDTVDVPRISAELKHGVLTLKLPKAEQAKPKRIEIKVG